MGTCDITVQEDGYRSVDWHPPFGPFITLSPEAWTALLESIRHHEQEQVKARRGSGYRR